MKSKTESAINETFRRITAYIANETGATYLLDTKLVYASENHSYARSWENTIFLSLSEYYMDVSQQSVIEYKKVVNRIKMPYYCDCAGYYHILTSEPDIYTLLHEISHIIVGMEHKNAPPHGEEFCDIYIHLIELIEPKTISPINGGFINWY